MKYVHLTLRVPPSLRNPMHTFVMDHDGMERAALLNWNFTDDHVDVLLFRVLGDRVPYERALDDARFVRDYETAAIDGTSFYVTVEHETRDADRQFRTPVFERPVLLIPPAEYLATGETRLGFVGSAGDVQGVLDDIPAEVDVRVETVGEYDRGLSPSAGVLTDRQREAIAAAADVGYYEVPREGTVEDVAAELDCAPSTASDHLRKAEARLVGQALDTG